MYFVRLPYNHSSQDAKFFILNAKIRPVSSTDHFPIITNIDLPQLRIPPDLSFNFRIADREDFNKTLKIKLNLLLHLEPINSLQELENAGNELTRVLQQTIKEKIT